MKGFHGGFERSQISLLVVFIVNFGDRWALVPDERLEVRWLQREGSSPRRSQSE